jgi:hypothetical protein
MAVDRGSSKQEDVEQALAMLGLTQPLTRKQLDERRLDLLATWHPHRYANLTNNPRKYMTMYRKGEAMTKAINAAYRLLVAWLEGTQERLADGKSPPAARGRTE